MTVTTNLTSTLQEEGKKVEVVSNKVAFLEGVKVEAWGVDRVQYFQLLLVG